jgi:hypothetical protein
MAHELRNPEVEAKLKQIGLRMKAEMPEGFGFTFLMFSHDLKTIYYLSSAERDSMIAAMREFIQKHEHN